MDGEEFIEYFHNNKNDFDLEKNKKNKLKNQIFIIEKVIKKKINDSNQLYYTNEKFNNDSEKTNNFSQENTTEDIIDDIKKIINEPNQFEKICGSKGRRKKGENSFRYKTKNSKDNIFRKIKVHFFRYLTNFLNNAIKSYFGVPKYIFRKLNNNIIVETSVEFNREIFNSTIEVIYSQDISDKYINCEKDCNKQLINKLKSIKEFQTIFQLGIKQMYQYYINPKCEQIIDKLIGISENIESFSTFLTNEKKLTEKNNINEKSFMLEDYYNNLEVMGKRLYEYLNNLKSRQLRKNDKKRTLII